MSSSSLRSRAGVLLLLAGLAGLAGCARPHAIARAPGWTERWPGLARAGPRWRAGAEFTVVTRERLAGGVRSTREHWVLLRRDSVAGEFEHRGDGRPANVETLRLHPCLPSRASDPGAAPGGPRACGPALEVVRVPAGRFRCGRTWHDVETPDGRVLRVDEWWAPGVPVAVQSWTRREGTPDSLRDPPRRAADLHAGTAWAVLETVRRP